MPYNGNITTSLHGRRLGLQQMSTVETGGSRGTNEYLVGPETVRGGVTTAESTGTNLNPFGISILPGTSAASSAVYTLDPPIPGVVKTISATTANNSVLYVKTANDEIIRTTAASTGDTTIAIAVEGGTFQLIGLTTALWGGIGLTTGTSSQASGFGMTTST